MAASIDYTPSGVQTAQRVHGEGFTSVQGRACIRVSRRVRSEPLDYLDYTQELAPVDWATPLGGGKLQPYLTPRRNNRCRLNHSVRVMQLI